MDKVQLRIPQQRVADAGRYAVRRAPLAPILAVAFSMASARHGAY
jgi:hypothetical protein